MIYTANTTRGFARGLSLIELLIAIGILAVSMMLIAAAFPAGVAMSIAISDETTSQSVFQEALAVIRDNYSVAKISAIPDTPAPTTYYDLIPDLYLGQVGGVYDETEGEDNREFGTNGLFSWSVLAKRLGNSGVMGNMFSVIVVVSRQPSGGPRFVPEDGVEADDTTWSDIPELRAIECTGSVNTRMLDIDDSAEFSRVPSHGYIIDGDTGQIYSMISRNEGPPDDTVTLLTAQPDDISAGRDFWIIPGEYEAGFPATYGRVSPAVRVFQTTLYLP